MRCVVTGSSGFIGHALAISLERQGHSVARWSRTNGWFDLAQPDVTTWCAHLNNIDVVIHLAAHVHIASDASDDARQHHHQINCQGTLELAKAALNAGVRRFIFLSTAKVFGEGEDGPYSLQSPPQPQDAYAVSKWEAEQGLLQMTACTPLALTVIRPPLVYGPGVSANFAKLENLARLPIPLPLAHIDNRRAMIGIDNLVDLIATCLDSTKADGVLLCSDAHPYSLPEVIGTIRAIHGQRRNLFALPPAWIKALGNVVLGKAAARRIFGNFEIDMSATCRALGWQPPFTMAQILGRGIGH